MMNKTQVRSAQLLLSKDVGGQDEAVAMCFYSDANMSDKIMTVASKRISDDKDSKQ